MMLLMTPGLWKSGLNGLSGVDWGAVLPMIQAAEHSDRAAGLLRQVETMVLHAYRKHSKQKSKQAHDLEQIRKTDPKAANINNYDLIDLENEVYSNG